MLLLEICARESMLTSNWFTLCFLWCFFRPKWSPCNSIFIPNKHKIAVIKPLYEAIFKPQIPILLAEIKFEFRSIAKIKSYITINKVWRVFSSKIFTGSAVLRWFERCSGTATSIKSGLGAIAYTQHDDRNLNLEEQN